MRLTLLVGAYAQRYHLGKAGAEVWGEGAPLAQLARNRHPLAPSFVAE